VRRLALSLTLIAAGAAMSAAAAWPGGAARNGGTFLYGSTGPSVQIDPQVAYVSTAWWLEYATAAKLFNWPDRSQPGAAAMLAPEAASSFSVSNRGKTYTFTIRKGFRFSDGAPVTAKNFAYAIDRVANHDLESPGAGFITDPSGTDIVGARAVNNGRALHVRGVTARGNRLVIRLTRADPSFLTKLTMPFFQATSTELPLTHEVTGAYPSAGPYAFTRNDADVLTSIRRNPFWARGPGRMRPRHLAGLDVHWGLDEQASFGQVQANQLDEASPPSAEVGGLGTRYGVNTSRFWAMPVNCIGWLLFNNDHGLFKDNVAMRRAVNWAVDRKAYASLSGPYTGFPWTHLLPPRSPGSIRARNLQPYWPAPNLARARSLAKGHFKAGNVTIAYPTTGRVYGLQAGAVRNDLVKLGFKPENVSMKPYSCELGPCLGPDDWNIIAGGGWCTDYPDPYAVFLTFATSNPYVQFPSLASAKYLAKLRAAQKLVGNARLRAFGKLDLEIMNRLAPVAVMRTYNNRYFFSNRVDPRSLSYSGVYSDWSIPALALK